MRITGGSLKGKRLVSFKGQAIRPTSDMVREAVFNMLGQRMDGVAVLDLFSGTGALSLEALSRGARSALMIDRSPAAIEIIRKNVRLCGVAQKCTILKWDLRKGVPNSVSSLFGAVNLVFMDPPYRRGYEVRLLRELGLAQFLSQGSRVVVESEKKVNLADVYGHLLKTAQRVYGDTKVTIYEKKE